MKKKIIERLKTQSSFKYFTKLAFLAFKNNSAEKLPPERIELGTSRVPV